MSNGNEQTMADWIIEYMGRDTAVVARDSVDGDISTTPATKFAIGLAAVLGKRLKSYCREQAREKIERARPNDISCWDERNEALAEYESNLLREFGLSEEK